MFGIIYDFCSTSHVCTTFVLVFHRGFQIQLTCKLCRESHKTQVWLCLLVLSTSGETNENVYLFLNSFQKSDAMLYAPRIQDFPDNCTEMVLNCYMLELKMVLREEEIEDNLQECVHDFNSNLQPSFSCETYTLQNITTFMERLMDLLQKLNST
uniref:Uncharacterized protein n=1 Tax=Oreochromis niloticus TaxID=8128 RepID=I3KLG7_ORENI